MKLVIFFSILCLVLVVYPLVKIKKRRNEERRRKNLANLCQIIKKDFAFLDKSFGNVNISAKKAAEAVSDFGTTFSTQSKE